jgi:tetratricopeptide (TPR) repeat protein
MNLLTALLISSSLVASMGSAFATETCAKELNAEDAFRKGADLAEAGRYEDAIPCLLIAYQTHSNSPAVLWNLGIANAEVGNSADALKYWLAYRVAEPNDWRAYAKLIQTHQALGDMAARDKERKALFELRRQAVEGSELRRAEQYCREQAKVGAQKLLAFEVFEPRGERAIYYFAAILNASGKEDFRISLGSYEFTNRVAHETGNLPKDKRLYHLDRYDSVGHTTFAFYEFQPTYEQFSVGVQGILSGTARPLSSTRSKTQ